MLCYFVEVCFVATDKPRFSLTIPDDVLIKVEQYQAKQKLSTKSKAIHRLIEIGLSESADGPRKEKSEGRLAVEERYYALDATGRKLVDAVMEIEAERFTAPEPVRKPTRIIPLFPAAAGPGEPVDGEAFDDYEVDADSPAHFAVRISGDSMEPELHDGEVVLCERRMPERGEIAVLMVNGFLLVKQFVPGYNGQFYMISINRERAALDYVYIPSGTDTLTTFGTVIHRKIPISGQ